MAIQFSNACHRKYGRCSRCMHCKNNTIKKFYNYLKINNASCKLKNLCHCLNFVFCKIFKVQWYYGFFNHCCKNNCSRTRRVQLNFVFNARCWTNKKKTLHLLMMISCCRTVRLISATCSTAQPRNACRKSGNEETDSHGEPFLSCFTNTFKISAALSSLMAARGLTFGCSNASWLNGELYDRNILLHDYV